MIPQWQDVEADIPQIFHGDGMTMFPDTIGSHDFRPQGRRHDFGYRLGRFFYPEYKDVTRRGWDLMQYYDMKENHGRFYAELVYMGVRLGGASAWRNNKKLYGKFVKVNVAITENQE
jgi:hypothetical protein